MGEAGPSGVDHDTASLTHANAAENHETMACPNYGALIASQIMLIGLGNSGGGLIMFGSLYLTKRRVMKRGKRGSKHLAMKKSIQIVLSRTMKMSIWIVLSRTMIM